jgi:hypothetical protein
MFALCGRSLEVVYLWRKPPEVVLKKNLTDTFPHAFEIKSVFYLHFHQSKGLSPIAKAFSFSPHHSCLIHEPFILKIR